MAVKHESLRKVNRLLFEDTGAQAAEAAGCPYVWSVGGNRDEVLSQLEGTIAGCVEADPSRRLDLAAVVERLAAMQVKLRLRFGGVVNGRAGPSRQAVYSVLSVVDAMEEASVEAGVVSSVADAIGLKLTCTLDALETSGVPAVQIARVRKRLDTVRPKADVATSVCKYGLSCGVG